MIIVTLMDPKLNVVSGEISSSMKFGVPLARVCVAVTSGNPMVLCPLSRQEDVKPPIQGLKSSLLQHARLQIMEEDYLLVKYSWMTHSALTVSPESSSL